MLNKFRRFIRKYPSLGVLILSGIAAAGLEQINKYAVAHAILFAVSAYALVPALSAMNNTLRHGFYGIHLLPITGLVFSLFLGHYWAAFVIALILLGEKPLLAFYGRRHKNDMPVGRAVGFSSINHAPFIRLLDRYSVSFTIMILLISGALWVVTGEAQRFLEVLLVASAIPLLVAPMLALKSGLNQARDKGIVFKSASVFEQLANTATVVLSKTGIITDEQTTIAEVKPMSGHTKTDVLSTAASLAVGSSHYLARAIVAGSGNIKINSAKHAREIPGMGIAGRLKGQSLYMGHKEFMIESGISIPDSANKPEQTVVYVARGDNLIGTITFKETYLPGTENIANFFTKLGIRHLILVSGAVSGAVKAAAKHTGINEFFADYRQSDKIRTIGAATNKPVAYVGNVDKDPAILTAADVSVGFGIEGKVADVFITEYSTAALKGSFQISRRSMQKARVVSLAGIFVTLVLVTVATTGLFTPLQSASLQLLTVIAITSLASMTRKS